MNSILEFLEDSTFNILKKIIYIPHIYTHEINLTCSGYVSVQVAVGKVSNVI